MVRRWASVHPDDRLPFVMRIAAAAGAGDARLPAGRGDRSGCSGWSEVAMNFRRLLRMVLSAMTSGCSTLYPLRSEAQPATGVPCTMGPAPERGMGAPRRL